jgi:hypothetical protein
MSKNSFRMSKNSFRKNNGRRSKNSYKKYSTMISPKALLIFLLASVRVEANFVLCKGFKIYRPWTYLDATTNPGARFISISMAGRLLAETNIKLSESTTSKVQNVISDNPVGYSFQTGSTRQTGQIKSSELGYGEWKDHSIVQGGIHVDFKCIVLPESYQWHVMSSLSQAERYQMYNDVLNPDRGNLASLYDAASRSPANLWATGSEFRKLVTSSNYRSHHRCGIAKPDQCSSMKGATWFQSFCWIKPRSDLCSHGECKDGKCLSQYATLNNLCYKNMCHPSQNLVCDWGWCKCKTGWKESGGKCLNGFA